MEPTNTGSTIIQDQQPAKEQIRPASEIGKRPNHEQQQHPQNRPHVGEHQHEGNRASPR